MPTTVIKINRISFNTNFTGYASIINEAEPCKRTKPKRICNQQINAPNSKPTIAPITVINQLSNKNMLQIVFKLAPKLRKVAISSFLSIISMVSEPILLNEAIINIKVSMM